MSTLTITTIQTDLKWEDKAANLRSLEDKILSIPGNTELVVLPEMFSTGFSMRPEALAERMDGPTLAWMRSVAARKRIILTGSIIIEDDGNYFNRLIWMLPNGEYGYYDKRHRFAYAGENEQYTAGHRRLVTSVKGWKILPLVCYDLRFPVWSRQTPAPPTGASEQTTNPAPPSLVAGATAHSAPTAISPPAMEYDILLYVANWPQRRSLAWKTLLQARAIENQSYVVGLNRVGNDGNNIYHSGDSMIIDPLGEILYHGAEKEDIFTITLQKETLTDIRQHFPFWRDADSFSIQP
ncbi:MAG TPA: nitrilase family protein [Puia sp.]|jgi:predicted amidohydrolase|nr:nitrilase family protein [Puia sp.]